MPPLRGVELLNVMIVCFRQLSLTAASRLFAPSACEGAIDADSASNCIKYPARIARRACLSVVVRG